MCSLSGSFKLCTCQDKIDPLEPHWVLYKGIKKSDNWTQVIGIIIPPSDDHVHNFLFISKVLNSENVFDFDYTTEENDKLSLKIKPQMKLEFIYNSGQWESQGTFGLFEDLKFEVFQKGKIC